MTTHPISSSAASSSLPAAAREARGELLPATGHHFSFGPIDAPAPRTVDLGTFNAVRRRSELLEAALILTFIGSAIVGVGLAIAMRVP